MNEHKMCTARTNVAHLLSRVWQVNFDGIRALAGALSENKTLTYLDLSYNGLCGNWHDYYFERKGVNATPAGGGAEIMSVDAADSAPAFAEHKDGPQDGILALAHALDHNTSLRHLNLRGNQMSVNSDAEEGIKALAGAMRLLTTLTVSNAQARHIESEPAQYLPDHP